MARLASRLPSTQWPQTCNKSLQKGRAVSLLAVAPGPDEQAARYLIMSDYKQFGKGRICGTTERQIWAGQPRTVKTWN
jgi:hypothetical protein